MPIPEDYNKYVGNRFGKLVVKSFSRKAAHSIAMMNVKCDCGIEKEVRLASLKCGRSNSCGCLKANTYKEKKVKHGGKGTSLYGVWCSMKGRCLCENNTSYVDYGGRGIKVCSEWTDSYLKFKNWSVVNGYKKGLSIDRVDNDKDYSPDNCRWVDSYVQANNTRKNVTYKFLNIEKTQAQWARHLGVSQKLISDRINKLGWSVERALSTKPRHMIAKLKQ